MDILSCFEPKNWTRFSKIEPQDDNSRRDTFFSQLLVVGTIFSVIHFFNDLYHGYIVVCIIDVLFILVLVSIYIFNEKGQHRLAKILNLGLLNIMIFVAAGLFDEEVRLVFILFPMAILAFNVFYKSELVISIIFSIIPMVLVLILEYTDYHPFGDIKINEGMGIITLAINILTSFVLLIVGMLFLLRLNNLAEKEQLAMQGDLRKSNEELDRFVYSASHDLRAPLRSVMGLTGLMKREKNNQNMVGYIEMVDQRITDLDSFVGDIIDHSRNSRVAVKKEKVDLEKLMDGIASKLRYMDGAKQISLIKDLKIHEISTDSSRLNIILTNLSSNAIKYADMKKEDQWVKFSSKLDADTVIITMEDNGIGIHENHHDQIFNMFYRASDQSEGSGLGLYIVNETIQKLGGRIGMSSNLKKGTKFTISLPIS